MKFLYFIFIFAMLIASGCASQNSLDIVRSDVDSVKTRLFKVERDLGSLRDESQKGIGSVQAEYKSDLINVRKLSADLQASMDSVRADVATLSGKLDDQSISAKQPVEDLALYRADADRRIVALDEKLAKLQATVDELNKKLYGEAKPQKVELVTPESVYAKGQTAFNSGDMPLAREVFTRFLDQYPKNALAANSQYWIGETFYREKSYEPAILAYQEVIKQYPKHEKIPAAMLKQGMSFKAIKDAKSAKYVFTKLVEGYPKSDEAKKAKEQLKGMK